jgi:peptide/nickel transport system permease protein
MGPRERLVSRPGPSRQPVLRMVVRSGNGSASSRRRPTQISGLMAKELASALVTVLLLSSCVFLALRLLPGDPTNLVLGDEASAEARHQLRQRLGLDASIAEQWIRFVWGMLCGNFGDSLTRPGLSAGVAVARATLPTAQLAGLAVVLGTGIGILAATLSVGILRPSGRAIVLAAIMIAASVPLLSFGPLLTWFLAVRLPLLPLPGDPDSGFSGWFFASTLLSLPLGAQVARVARASLLDQSQARYLDVARAKGAGPFRVWLVHALPVAAPPIIVVVAMQLGALLGGAVVLERLFERPGLGTLMLEAYRSRDLPVLQAAVVAAGTLFVLAQTLAQVLQTAIDPRRGGANQDD